MAYHPIKLDDGTIINMAAVAMLLPPKDERSPIRIRLVTGPAISITRWTESDLAQLETHVAGADSPPAPEPEKKPATVVKKVARAKEAVAG